MESSNRYLHKYYAPQGVEHYPGQGSSTLPARIDDMVAHELDTLKSHFANQEQIYVDQMLREHPIVVEKRAATTIPASKAAEVTAASDVQRQRAESCRKSRYNNKIKKAKLRFRHKFISRQLTESAVVLEQMRTVIAEAEAQLLSRGFNRSALEQMRRDFGLDRSSALATSKNIDHWVSNC